MSLMSFGLGGGGYAAQGSDPNLGDKLAALKRRGGSPDDRLEAFLTRDVGVDPSTLPFTSVTAREFVKSWMFDDYYSLMQLQGTSMGLTQVISSGHDADTVVADSTHEKWADLVKVFEALCREHPERYTFSVSHMYGDVEVTPVAPHVAFSDPTRYPPGSVLRIERTAPQGEHLVVERQYIRIGGLLDDTTPTILDTMQPMDDLTGWTVCEELA